MNLPTQLAQRAAKAIKLALGLILEIDPSSTFIAGIIDRETSLPEWKEALEGLTPSGSEFVDDPKACASYAHGRLDAAQEGFKDATIRSRKLDDAATALLQELKELIGDGSACAALLSKDYGFTLREVRKAAEALRLVLDTPNEKQLEYRRRGTLAAKVEPGE